MQATPASQDTPSRLAGRRWVLLVVALGVSLLLAEGLLRLLWANPFAAEDPERVLVLQLQHANADQRWNRAQIAPDDPKTRFRTDARGYLLPSRRFQRPHATVAFIGGSTTECSAVREDLRFPALVSTLLEKRGLKVDTLNAGRSGNTLQNGLTNLVEHIVDDRPDVVVVMHVANDVGVLTTGDGTYPRKEVTSGVRAGLRGALQLAARHSSFVGIVRQVSTISRLEPKATNFAASRFAGAKVPDARPFEARLRAFIGVCKGFGIVPVLVTEPLATVRTSLTPDWANPDSQDVFNYVVRQVAAQEGVVLLDLSRHLVENVPGYERPMQVFYDAMHVTDAGSRIYADFLAGGLAELVLPKVLARRQGQPVHNAAMPTATTR